MTMASGRSDVLESLIIELIGDDDKLQAIFDQAITSAKTAAQRISQAFTEGFSGVDKVVDQTSASMRDQRQVVDATTKILEGMVSQAEVAFRQTAQAGQKSEQAFEDYRREVLAVIDASEANARVAGVSTQAYDRFRRMVKETEYAQRQQKEESRDQQTETKKLDHVIRDLSARIATQRNLWAGRITSDEEFEKSTRELKNELLELSKSTELTDVQMRRVTQSMAYAQRGLDSAAGVASRGGLAWTAQIAISNQLGQSLRNLGPAGNVAAGALGFMGAAVSGLQAPLKFTDFELNRVLASAARFATVLIPMATALATVAGAAGLAALTVSAARAAREIENATYRTGLGAEALQELQHAARSTGVPMELLATTMQRLQRRAADANSGNKLLQQAFQQLGVKLTDSHGAMRSTEDLLGQVADGLNQVENNADKVALAFKIFDTEGGRLLPLLNEGSDGIARMREEARELGLVISGDTILSLSQFQAEIETVKQQFEVLRIEVAAAFLPVMRDLLIPLVRDQLVPWIGNIALRVQDFSQSLFDTTVAGTTFRADLVQSLGAFITFGRAIVGISQAALGAINSLLSGFSFMGGFLGAALSPVDFQAMRESAETTANFWLGRALELDMELRNLQDESRRAELEAAADHAREMSRLTGAAAVELQGGRFGFAVQSAIDASIGHTENAIGNFEGMIGAFTTDFTAWLETWVQDSAVGATPSARKALKDLVDNAVGGALETPPPEGSIAYAEMMVQQYGKAFREASSDEARATAQASLTHWEAVRDALLAPFTTASATAAAQAWTERLTAELRHGMKEPIEVFDLLTQGVYAAQQRLENVRLEFGIDSVEYRSALEGLQFLERWLVQFQRDFATTPLTITIEAEVTDIAGFMPDFTLPAQTMTPTQAIVQFYERLTRVADAQARLNGVTRETRDAYAETIEILEAIHPGLDVMSDDWLLVANLLASARDRLAEVDEELAGEPSTALVDFLARVAEVAGEARAAILGAWAAAASSGPVTAVQGALATSQGVTRDQRVAAALGEDFDATASEIDHLTREVTGLAERYDELGLIERIRLSVASARLRQLRDQADAEEDAADAVTEFQTALEKWNAAVEGMGRSEDPLAARARELEAWLAQGLITTEQFDAMLAQLAAAQDRLASGLDPAAFDSWLSSVNSIGVTLGPVDSALVDLALLLDEGSITAEQYAAGVDAVNAALDRLAETEAGEKVQEITASWETALGQIRQLMGQGASQFDALYDAATDAFQAGIISADEFNEALRAIDVLRLADGFRQVASELSGAGQVIPNFVADIAEAWLQFESGDRLGAITSAFSAATAAVEGLQAAFSDTANVGGAMLDLLIGGASAIATAIGGPALGQAVAAVGGFVKAILGDLSNGLAEIQQAIDRAASSSAYLSEALIEGIAASNTDRVSRGGILGFLGLKKAQLDEEGFRAGVAIAEGIANGLVGTLTAGDFEEAWTSMVNDILVQGVIEAFMTTQAVQDAIGTAFEFIAAGEHASAVSALEVVKTQFQEVWEIVQEIIGDSEDFAVNVSGSLAQGIAAAFDSSSVDEAWERATLSMKNTLRDAIIQAFVEGEAMKAILDEFNAALTNALSDGVITEQELRRLEEVYGQAEGPLRELWDALEALGLGFDDLNDTISSVTSSLSNVPSVFLDTQARFDSLARDVETATSSPITLGKGPVEMPILIEGDVYGFEDFEAKVSEALGRARNRSGLATHGVPRVGY